jgi:hypothetical protein
VRRRLALLGVAALLAAGAAAEDEPPPGPRIRVEPESFDFGKALPDKVLRREFSVRNFGDAPLVIEGVSTTCGCTAALTASSRVDPGGSTTLRVTFETRRYTGRVERQVLVRSNDPKTPVLRVKVSVTVEKGTEPKR